MKIGFFDSGLGGLTIMDAVRDAMPQYDYYYYGDTAHVPYGDRSETEVYELTKAGVRHLFENGVLIAIIACNTASAETLRRLQDTFLIEEYPDRRILGVVIPTIEALLDSGSTKPFLLATQRTVQSGKYQYELDKVAAAHVELRSLATPKLVPLLESGAVDDAGKEAVQAIVMHEADIDAVILGCTHYTMLKTFLRAQAGDRYTVFSQDEIIPERLALYLKNHPELACQLSQAGACERCFTGQPHE